MKPRLEIIAVGDVHELFDDVDRRFLDSAPKDLVVFVGDLGDEDLGICERVASIRAEVVVVLGNHDAWWSFRHGPTPAFRRSLEVLGDRHLGFRARVIPGTEFGVLGARPFTWGGPMERTAGFFREMYGVDDELGAADRIVAAADELPPELPLVVVAHNGPLGLGEGRAAPFGRDFKDPPIDFGDADLAFALDRLRRAGRKVPVLLAGHMHETLRGGGLRERRAERAGTVCVNAAVVPRHRRDAAGAVLRHFVRVVVEGDALSLAEDLWVDDDGNVAQRIPIAEAPRREGRPVS